MEQEEKHSLLQPLIIPSFTPSTTLNDFNHRHIHDDNKDDPSNNNNNIIFRILLILLVATISIWANYEASKTFQVIIVNDTKDTLAGHRFDLSYVSNDEATRIVLNTSSFVEHLLYPNNQQQRYHKKHIDTVTLRLSHRNLNATTTVTAVDQSFKGYVIDISPKLLEDGNYYDKMAVVSSIQRAMARVWLWDGGSTAPQGLVDGVAEYITELAGFRRQRVSGESPECEGRWWEDEDPRHVARYLNYCEKYKKGFIQRLNEAMRDTWHDRMVDDVLGMSAMKICGLYNVS